MHIPMIEVSPSYKKLNTLGIDQAVRIPYKDAHPLNISNIIIQSLDVLTERKGYIVMTYANKVTPAGLSVCWTPLLSRRVLVLELWPLGRPTRDFILCWGNLLVIKQIKRPLFKSPTRDWCKHRLLCVGGLKQSHIALGANEIDAMSYRIQEFLDKVCQV